MKTATVCVADEARKRILWFERQELKQQIVYTWTGECGSQLINFHPYTITHANTKNENQILISDGKKG
jgi:hypothetical protein